MEFARAGLWLPSWKKIPDAAEELEGPPPAVTLDGPNPNEGPTAGWRLESRYLSSAVTYPQEHPFEIDQKIGQNRAEKKSGDNKGALFIFPIFSPSVN